MKKKNTTKKKNAKQGTKNTKEGESFAIIKNQTYTPKQLADWWQLQSIVTVLRAIRNNGLKAARVGRGYRVLGSDALEYHKRMRVYRR